jgi:hypothetical protein
LVTWYRVVWPPWVRKVMSTSVPVVVANGVV